MGKTHHFALIGDGHVYGRRGPAPKMLDPVLGVELSVLGQTGVTAEVNTFVRGATSGAVARITRSGGTGATATHQCEGAGFLAFQAGETLNFDSGGTATASIIISASLYQGGSDILSEHRDAEFNTPVPNDRVSDTPFWDDHAKLAQRIELTGVTGAFAKGDRCTTSAGGAFTVLKVAAGPPVSLWIVRKSGTIAATNTVTNTTQAGGGTISLVDADPPQGMWMALDARPNWSGLADSFEFIPLGTSSDGGEPGYGPGLTLMRQIWDHWAANADPNERGSRLCQYSGLDDLPGDANAFRGGVSVQCVPLTGISGTFTNGETVTGGGGWSATVQNVNTGLNRLYVYATNGATLTPGATVTGGTSGATATAPSGCYGWQPGSKSWNNMIAHYDAARSAPGATYAGQAERYEGVFLAIWEMELGSFPTGEAVWPTLEQATTAWVLFIAALREYFDQPELPIALLHMDVRSHAADIAIGSIPFAYGLRTVQSQLALYPHISLVSCAGMEGETSGTLPYPSSILFLRTDDYLEMGRRAWRSLQYATIEIPPGAFRPMVLILTAGQSQMRQNQPAAISTFDREPEMYPSATYPGMSTIDPKVWMWNADPTARVWQPFDVALNGNTFWNPGAGTFSYVPAVLAARFKDRFAVDGVQADIGIIHLAVNSSSANGNLPNAVTWDPVPQSIHQVSAAMTVTVLGVAGNPLNPLRGRFTAANGTFSQFNRDGEHANVSGSLLGYVGSGGNNHWEYYAQPLYARDTTNGAWIELEGIFAAETATLTIKRGPLQLWTSARDNIRMALRACTTQLQRIPKPVLKVWWQSESDVADAGAYEQALTRVLDEIELEFGQRHKGETPTPTVVVRQTNKTPGGTDEAVAALRAAHESYVADHGNAAIVNTDDLPMEDRGVWPRLTRQDNDYHHTMSGYRISGFLIDRAAGTLIGIPPHPAGEAAVDYGAVDGGVDLTGTGLEAAPSESFTEESEGEGSAMLTTATASSGTILEEIDAAILASSDVAAYTINGRTVQKQSLSALIEARKYYEAQQSRARGLRRTKVRFS